MFVAEKLSHAPNCFFCWHHACDGWRVEFYLLHERNPSTDASAVETRFEVLALVFQT